MRRLKIHTIISKEARAALSDIIGSYFDSGWYLKTYPEAKISITSGQFSNALEHYLEIGINEKKSPNSDFDEINYLSSDEEARIAVEQGEFKCGYHYFLTYKQNKVRPLEMIAYEDVMAKKLLIDIFDSKIDTEVMEGKHSKTPSQIEEVRRRCHRISTLGQ